MEKVKQRFYGWKLVACLCAVMALTMGFGAYGASVMNTQMMIDMQLNRESLGLAIGSFALVMGMSSPLAGVFVHRWGARAALSLGTLVMALSALAMATVVNSLISVVLVYGLVMGCGAAMGSGIPAQTVVSYWFKKRLAMALTLTVMGSNLGGFVAAPLLARVITAFDGNWRMGWFVVAAACAAAFCCVVFFVSNKPSDMGQLQDGGEQSQDESDSEAGSPPALRHYKTTVDWEFAEVVRHPASWWIIIGAVCSGAALGMVVGHGVAHFMDLGHSPEVAASFLGTVVGTGFAGRILFAGLGDRIEPRFVLSASLFLMALGMLLVIDATSVIELYVSATLVGLGSALPTLCMAAMAVNYFGQNAFSRFVGLAGLFMALTPAILVVVTGIVFDRMGSYAPMFYTAMAAFVLIGLVMPLVRPPAPPAR